MPRTRPRDHAAALAAFVSESPSSHHAAAEVARQLTHAGFTQLDERETWAAAAGRHYVVRDGAVVAWSAPDDVTGAGFRIVGAHTDSPALKLKPAATFTRYGWQQAGVEIYGGPLLNSWLDRELCFAGRLCTVDGDVHLVRTGPVARVPQLAPHLDRSVNESLSLDRQRHLQPLFAVSSAGDDIEEHLCELAGIDIDELAFHDVVAFPVEAPALFGLDEQFLASPRLDNLSSVHAGLTALLAAEASDDVCVLAAFDHEEVGSATRSGASGPLLSDVLSRIAAAFGVGDDAYLAMLARSSCISADAGHAINPNYPHVHDPETHPVINAGPLLKINANQRYATDAAGAALWRRACIAAEVPSQDFVSNNAVPCGSTIGPLTATRLGITTVDVGIPLLAMHSAREMCGVDDPLHLSWALQAYFSGA